MILRSPSQFRPLQEFGLKNPGGAGGVRFGKYSEATVVRRFKKGMPHSAIAFIGLLAETQWRHHQWPKDVGHELALNALQKTLLEVVQKAPRAFIQEIDENIAFDKHKPKVNCDYIPPEAIAEAIEARLAESVKITT